MSSVARAPSQIGPREKYLLAIAETTYYVPNEGATINTLMTVQEFTDATQAGPFIGIASSLYRDLGKEVYTLDGSQRQVALYRLCQRVLGATTEGVPVSYDEYDKFYIRVWAANPLSDPVTVARIG